MRLTSNRQELIRIKGAILYIICITITEENWPTAEVMLSQLYES